MTATRSSYERAALLAPRHAGPLLRRRDRHGRQRLPRRSRRRAHADAVERRPQCRLLRARTRKRLYLPVIIDPEYHYETVNVEAQLDNPDSLLWWMRRLIALRRAPGVRSRLARVPHARQPPCARVHAARDGIRRRPVSRCSSSRTSRASPSTSSSISTSSTGCVRSSCSGRHLPGDRRPAVPAHARTARLLLAGARAPRAPSTPPTASCPCCTCPAPGRSCSTATSVRNSTRLCRGC